jgi:hypothetical protein
MSSKKKIKKLIEIERQQLALSVENLHQATRDIKKTSFTAFHNPLRSLNKTLGEHLSSKQLWEAMGVAFIFGSTVSYLNRKERLNSAIETNSSSPASSSSLSGFVEPLAVEFVDELQLLCYRGIKNLFQSV